MAPPTYPTKKAPPPSGQPYGQPFPLRKRPAFAAGHSDHPASWAANLSRSGQLAPSRSITAFGRQRPWDGRIPVWEQQIPQWDREVLPQTESTLGRRVRVLSTASSSRQVRLMSQPFLLPGECATQVSLHPVSRESCHRARSVVLTGPLPVTGRFCLPRPVDKNWWCAGLGQVRLAPTPPLFLSFWWAAHALTSLRYPQSMSRKPRPLWDVAGQGPTWAGCMSIQPRCLVPVPGLLSYPQ